MFVARCFRRDAKNHTPEACAPENTPSCPSSIPEFGIKARFPVPASPKTKIPAAHSPPGYENELSLFHKSFRNFLLANRAVFADFKAN
jgi:hypothetical protein